MIEDRLLWGPRRRIWSHADVGLPNVHTHRMSMPIVNHQNAGVWTPNNFDSQLSLEPGFGLVFPNLPYTPHFGLNGARRFQPDRNDPARYIDFEASRFMANRTFQAVDVGGQDYRIFRSPGSVYDIEIIIDHDRFGFDVVVKDLVAYDALFPNGIELPYDLNGISEADFDRYTRLRVEDSNPDESNGITDRKVDVTKSNGVITLGVDFTGLVGPVRIDPTESIGASSDDGFARALTASGYSTSNSVTIHGNIGGGNEEYGSWYRYTGLTDIDGETISACELQNTFSTDEGDAANGSGVAYFEEALSPSIPTSETDFRDTGAHVPTVAQATVTGWPITSGSHNAVITGLASSMQELIDDTSGAITTVQVIVFPDDKASNQGARYKSYDGSPSSDSADLVFTTGGGGATPTTQAVIIS